MQLEVFKNKNFEVRSLEVDGQAMFCLADVCRALELSKPSMVAEAIKSEFGDGVRQTYPITDSLGREQKAIFITEPQLYFVMHRSNKPRAKSFRMWVNAEVLPAIRKHGGYLTEPTIDKLIENPDLIIELATNLKAEKARRQKLEAQAQADMPYVSFAKSVEASVDSILLGNYAKILSDEAGFSIGQNRLFEALREMGYLITGTERHNTPYQKYIDMGYFKVTTQTYAGSTGTHQRFTTKITGKGQIALAKKILQRFGKIQA